MKNRFFWKLCLIIATGIVAFFYVISLVTSETEDGMSLLAIQDQQQITAWGKQAESLYNAGELLQLEKWLTELQAQEHTWATVASYQIDKLAGNDIKPSFYQGYNLGRNVEWKVHLYFDHNPVMEVPFTGQQISFLIQLPDRMRPGMYWQHTEIAMQIVLPMLLLALMSVLLYRYIMNPLQKLQEATQHFSRGDLDVRASKLMGYRADEFSDLAKTFDQMASRIGELIVNQRQLIADMSHELRTPLARLDMAVDLMVQEGDSERSLARIRRESGHIRRLVEDTLTLAWLDNEQPQLSQESLDLVDLLDVLVEDARFEFPDRQISCDFPDSAQVHHSSHRAAGQALENILRNALRYTPTGQVVSIKLADSGEHFDIHISDQGPGVPSEFLTRIFQPFFRVDKSRGHNSDSFGLGLALAQRQLAMIGANVKAQNLPGSGLCMHIRVPRNNALVNAA